MGKKFVDITGSIFGNLTALKREHKNKSGSYEWELICSCGKTCLAAYYDLAHGKVKSCGCLKTERVRKINASHGMSNSREYDLWRGMKKRVLNPNSPDFNVYSLLGIEEEWKTNFMAFYTHIGPCPKDGNRWSIDRIDRNTGYYKNNLRWATDFQQARNRGLSKANNSGFTGVHWGNSKNVAVASWIELDGRQRTKHFNIKKYGLLPAFAMACAYRERMIEQLNEKGAGYAANHGK